MRLEDQLWLKSELLAVAKHQKSIQWMILIGFAGLLLMVVFPPAPFLIALIQLVFVYSLAAAVRSSAPWLYCFVMFIPLIGLMALLSINSRATNLLKHFGVRVGLMGARMEDFDKLPDGQLA